MTNRVELHINTMMSPNISIINPIDLEKKAKELNYHTVALMDYNSVASFPKFAKISSEKLKIIYGVEVTLLFENEELYINLLVKNKSGLKDLYKIMSEINTTLFVKYGRRILIKNILSKYRGNILVGYSCNNGNIKNKKLLEKIISYCDYVEISLIKENINEIMSITNKYKKILCASSNPYYLKKEDKVYRDAIFNIKNKKITNDNYYYTTSEMFDLAKNFNKSTAIEIILTNPNKIANLCDDVSSFITLPNLMLPKFVDSKEKIENYVYKKIHNLYGYDVPKKILMRVKEELDIIFKNKYDVLYLIVYLLVKKIKQNNNIIQSRYATSSSFISYLLGITSINPLKPHYRCSNCKNVIFKNNVSIGYDLPDKDCPKCHHKMIKDGCNINYEMFLKNNIIPNFALNTNNNQYLKYIKQILGKDCIYYAKLIGTYTKHDIKNVEENIFCTQVKKIEGRYSGKLLIIPDISSVTSISYDTLSKSAFKTISFDYKDLKNKVLELNIYENNVSKMLNKLQKITNKKIDDIPLNDFNVIESISKYPFGISEFDEMNKILKKLKPINFGELIKILGIYKLGIWNKNLKNKIDKSSINNIISSKDELIDFLVMNKIDKDEAFEIMQFISNGGIKKNPITWQRYKKQLQQNNISNSIFDMFESNNILYFKGYLISNIVTAYQLAWYKLYKPLEFYKLYFEIINTDIDILTIKKGKKIVKQRIHEMENNCLNSTNLFILKGLKIVYEAMNRGIKFNIENNCIKIKIKNNYTYIDCLLHKEIKKFIIAEKEINVAKIQRKFKLGYNHALNIIDFLKEEKMV